MILDPIVVQIAALTGFTAAAIAVGGFAFHAREAIAGGSQERLQRLTAIGGVCGVIGVAVAMALGVVT